ncbi:MAG: ion channel, partial [Myxococcota bacterium]
PRIVNAPRSSLLRDLHHAFLRWSWLQALGALALGWLVENLVFAFAYAAVGGIAEMRPGSLVDAFHFSVQTFGTIGYGAMHPASAAANVLVDLESITSLVLTAVGTGLVFSKFARPVVRVAFGRWAAIGPMDGEPTLMVRVGNERGNRIVNTELRMVMVRTERLAEGTTFYRMLDLKLHRDRAPALSRSLLLLHRIDPTSPLYGLNPQLAADLEVELMVSINGTDDVTLAPMHALHQYGDQQIAWGARHADILSEDPDGTLVLDVAKFHDLQPTEPTEAFPYRWSG